MMTLKGFQYALITQWMLVYLAEKMTEAKVFSLWKHPLDTGEQFGLSCHVVLQSY